VIYVGASQLPVNIGSPGGATVANMNFPVLGTQGSALSTVDILASSYLRTNATISQISNGGREGGIVSLDASGNQNFIVLGSGFDDPSDPAKFVQLVLNAERDAALLTVVQEDGGIMSARLSSDHFVVSADGLGVQFFGGLNDFEFFDSSSSAIEQEFANFRNAIDQVLAGL
jgi:hypothetical protein